MVPAKSRHGCPESGGGLRVASSIGTHKIYVIREVHDDLPWVRKGAGKRSLVIGTDYGHLAPTTDTDAILAFRQLDGIREHNVLDSGRRSCRALHSI